MTLSRVEEHAAAHSCELEGSDCSDLWTKRRAKIRKEGRVSIIVVICSQSGEPFSGGSEGEVHKVFTSSRERQDGLYPQFIQITSCTFTELDEVINSRGEIGMGVNHRKNLLSRLLLLPCAAGSKSWDLWPPWPYHAGHTRLKRLRS